MLITRLCELIPHFVLKICMQFISYQLWLQLTIVFTVTVNCYYYSLFCKLCLTISPVLPPLHFKRKGLGTCLYLTLTEWNAEVGQGYLVNSFRLFKVLKATPFTYRQMRMTVVCRDVCFCCGDLWSFFEEKT